MLQFCYVICEKEKVSFLCGANFDETQTSGSDPNWPDLSPPTERSVGGLYMPPADPTQSSQHKKAKTQAFVSSCRQHRREEISWKVIPINAVGGSWNREHSGFLELDLNFLTPQEIVETLRCSSVSRGGKGAEGGGRESGVCFPLLIFLGVVGGLRWRCTFIADTPRYIQQLVQVRMFDTIILSRLFYAR